MKHVLLIDNYDSFTYNIKSYFEQLGARVSLVRNDALSVSDILALNPTHLLISPGPGSPEAAGICVDLVKRYYRYFPILGICLGHQCIASAFGAHVVRARQVMHGKTSKMMHVAEGLFKALPAGFTATRYHSLVVARESLPACFSVDAWVENEPDLIMAIRHHHYPVFGLQYHPEAILTAHGMAQLSLFLRQG